MQIEKATKKDTDSIVRLLRYCVGDSAEREAREYLESKDTLTLMAVADNKAVGFITVLLSFENADLLDIAVDEKYRRQGIAYALVAEMLRQTDARSVTLEVRESNLPARAFYVSCGFKEISRRKKYYTAPVEDAIIYQRVI